MHFFVWNDGPNNVSCHCLHFPKGRKSKKIRIISAGGLNQDLTLIGSANIHRDGVGSIERIRMLAPEFVDPEAAQNECDEARLKCEKGLGTVHGRSSRICSTRSLYK